VISEQTNDTPSVGQTAEQIIRAILGKYDVGEVEPGVYAHTFTPPAMSAERMLQVMGDTVANACADTDYFYVAPATVWHLRRAHLYGVNHWTASRKLRKYALRRKQARVNQGKCWLKRRQRNEQKMMEDKSSE
jgi:hypothetical protein